MEQNVLVIGGGFGGVYATRALLKQGFRVTMVSETNYFVFHPLLHEVATGGLQPNNIVFEYSSFFKNDRFTFYRETVTGVDFDKREVTTSDNETLSYDYLVFATGSRANFFGTPGSEHVLTLKDIPDALKIKREIIRLAQGVERHVAINIVGGGPTGVELALEVYEFLLALKERSPKLAYTIRLIHAEDTLCSFFPASTSAYALDTMKSRGIDVRLNTMVTEISEDGVTTKDGENLSGDMTIWTAGVTPNTSLIPDEYKDERGNVVVNNMLQIKGLVREFAVGDVIAMEGVRVPKLGQTAIKQGKRVAQNIEAIRDGKPLLPYNVHLNASLLSLGRWRGAGEVRGVDVRGIIGWIVWRGGYLFKTPGLRNKFEVFFTWAGNTIASRDLIEG